MAAKPEKKNQQNGKSCETCAFHIAIVLWEGKPCAYLAWVDVTGSCAIDSYILGESSSCFSTVITSCWWFCAKWTVI